MSSNKGLLILCFNLILCTELCFSDSNVVDVNTSSGVVRGQTLQVLDRSVNQFLGIPFSEPPIGKLRFAKPKPLTKPIQGIIDATESGIRNSCPQSMAAIPNIEELLGNLTVSEDCLVLNIWSPEVQNNESLELKPVMFWLYGGGLTIGTIFATDPNIDGLVLNGSALATHEVVFVSTNYRLGALGFLYGGDESAPGNMGFYDQLLALKWVRDNIHLFGGNKHEITIFGQSAGSWSVSAHLRSPLSKGLFRRAIMESGALMFNKDREMLSKSEALSQSKQLAKAVNCSDDSQWLECLRKVDRKVLLNNYNIILNNSNIIAPVPTEGTEFLPLNAQNGFSEHKFNSDIDLIAGVVKTEGSSLATVYLPGVNTAVNEIDFINLVNITNNLFHNLNIENIVEFYLNNTSDPESIKWAFYQFYGDLLITCPTYLFAKRYAIQSPNSNVFFYEWTYESKYFQNTCPQNLMGICHGADLEYVFGAALLHPDIYDGIDIDFSKQTMKTWTDFAKSGKTNSNWPKFIDHDGSIPTVKDFNPNNLRKMFNNSFEETCGTFWKNYFYSEPNTNSALSTYSAPLQLFIALIGYSVYSYIQCYYWLL